MKNLITGFEIEPQPIVKDEVHYYDIPSAYEQANRTGNNLPLIDINR